MGTIAALAGLVGTAMCVGEFDTTRVPDPNEGTVGEEVFHVVCERVDVGENPGDIDFSQARPFCTGAASLGDGGMTTNAAIGPKVRAMSLRRSAIANAIDTTIPMSLYRDMDGFLWNLLPLYGTDNGHDASTVLLADGGMGPADEDLLPQTTRSLATLLQNMAADDAVVNAFARFSLHQGYRPPRVALGLTRGLLGYSQLSTVLDHLLGLVRDPNISAPAGPANDDWHAVLDILRGELSNAAPAPPADQQHGTTLDALLDLVFRTNAALASGHPRLLVRRDPFGMPRIAGASPGSVPAPFVDTNPADGFADSVAGHFVDRTHTAIIMPSPFPANEAPDGPRDASGRALNSQGGVPIYEYVDLDQSVLGALLHDARTLVDPANNIAMRFANGAGALFGARTMITHDYMLTSACAQPGGAFDQVCTIPPVTFRGFDPSRNAPMVDLVNTIGLMLTSSDIDRILSVTQDLFTNHEAPLARAMGAMLAINDSSRMHPESVMDPRSNIWDDMMDVARQIAQQPGLLEDFIRAASDPQTVNLGHAFGAYAQYRDRIEPDWSSQTTQNQSLAGRTLSIPVDRTRPDTVDTSGGPMDNRSVFERFLHLIHDLDGVRLCNKEGARLTMTVLGVNITVPGTYHACDLIEIDDAAVFFLQSIIGRAHIVLKPAFLNAVSSIPGLSGTLDNIIESQSGITGFNSHPTPQAIARLVFQPDRLRTPFIRDLLDPPTTRDGLVVRDIHPGTLFALELYNFYAAVRPIVTAFDNHMGADHLFVELLSQLHMHYPTNHAGQFQNTNPSGALFDTMDGAERYEPILVDAFNGDLLAATNQLTNVLPGIDAGGGRTGVDAIASLARVLLDPNAITNITYRDGRTSTVRSDGTTPVNSPSIYYLFADAMNGIDTAFASAPSQLMDWQAARSQLVDTFLAVDGAGTSGAQFHNRRIPIVSQIAVQWVRDRIAAHQTLGDEDAWARGLAARFADTVHGPSFAASFNLLMDLNNDAPTRNAVGGLLMDLLDDTQPQPDTNFGAVLTAAADTIQVLRADADIDPLLHVLASGFQRRVTTPDGRVVQEGNVPVTLRFVDRANSYDDNHTLETVLRNAVTRPAMPLLADEPLVVLGDSIAEVHRVRPGQGGPLDANDFRSVFSEVAEFFTDGSRGMEQFYYIVQHRRF